MSNIILDYDSLHGIVHQYLNVSYICTHIYNNKTTHSLNKNKRKTKIKQ